MTLTVGRSEAGPAPACGPWRHVRRRPAAMEWHVFRRYALTLAPLPRKCEVARRVVGAQEFVVEHDGVYRAGVYEQDSQSPGVDHGVPDRPVQPGVDSGVLLDEEPVTEQIPLLEQVVDHIPDEIHQFMDRCVHRWCRHRSIILPGTDSNAEPFGVSSRQEYSMASLAEQGRIMGPDEGQMVLAVSSSARTTLFPASPPL